MFMLLQLPFNSTYIGDDNIDFFNIHELYIDTHTKNIVKYSHFILDASDNTKIQSKKIKQRVNNEDYEHIFLEYIKYMLQK